MRWPAGPLLAMVCGVLLAGRGPCQQEIPARAPSEQQMVSVVSNLPPSAAKVVQDFLTSRFADAVSFTTLPLPQMLAEIRSGVGVGGQADVLAFIDAHALATLERDGHLRRGHESPATYVLTSSCLWVPALRTTTGIGTVHLEDLLFRHDLDGRVVAPDVVHAPSVYTDLLARNMMRSAGERQAFGWLMTLDARLRGYLPVEALMPALQDGVTLAALSPLGEVVAAGLEPSFKVSNDDVLHQSLGLALLHKLALKGAEAGPAADVMTALSSDLLVQRLADEAFLLPVQGTSWQKPALLRDIVRKTPSLSSDLALSEAWLHRLRTEIVGHGRNLQEVSLTLEMIFAVFFVCFLIFVHRQLRKVE